MRVFLTSDTVLGADVLRQLLERSGHTVEEPTTAGAGALLASSDWSADATIAVMWAKRPPRRRFEAILVEIGIAIGRNIPVLLLTKRGVSHPSLTGVPRIETNIENIDADEPFLITQVALFLRGVATNAPRREFFTDSTTSLPAARPTLRSMPGRNFEQQVGEVLKATGSEVLTETNLYGSSNRADFAIYLPGHESELGLILVEAKAVTGEHRGRRLREAMLQLSQHVINARASLGVLVYDGKSIRLSTTPLVVSMPLAELSNRLTEESFPEILRQARNEAIHAL